MRHRLRFTQLLIGTCALLVARGASASYLELNPSNVTFSSPVPSNSFVDVTIQLVLESGDVATGGGFSYGGAELVVLFDQSKVTLSNVALGASIIALNNTQGTSFANSVNLDNTTGRLIVQQIDGSTAFGSVIPTAGSYSLVGFRATLTPGLTEGVVLVDLARDVTVGTQTRRTRVADQLGVPHIGNPGPLNGLDPRDLRFTITAVPEPSAFVSLGLGLAFLSFLTIHRRFAGQV